MNENKPRTLEAEISNEARATLSPDDRFRSYMSQHWQPRTQSSPELHDAAAFAAARRRAVSAAFAGKRLVIEAGTLKQRSNDTFYPFRAHSAFTHLTGWGCEAEPGSVLVFDPVEDGHDVTLFFLERASFDSDEFFANSEVGEFWIGPRPSLQDVSLLLGLSTKSLHEFTPQDSDLTLADAELAQMLSELRLVKDSYEIQEMRAAVDATAQGFHDVLAALPQAVAAPRGERVVEGVFHSRARLDGYNEGYETIAASGPHATTLHWIRNDGEVKPGDLLLLDAGVEIDSLYTADITRTIPVNGTFSPIQRKIYEAVLEAADAAFTKVVPGNRFHDVHDAALAVIERKIREWGLWPDDAEEGVPYHKRYMVHGTSHHLGIDVHDCAQARRDMYYGGEIKPGMIFTIEPGLYFHEGDLTVPEEYRGIGVRIEDDVLVTESGYENLSASLPRTASEVEAWAQNPQAQRARPASRS